MLKIAISVYFISVMLYVLYVLANAEMYGIYPPSDEDDEEAAEDADDSIGGCWYDYVPEKHDMYYAGTSKPQWS